jgi:hypothetical protein
MTLPKIESTRHTIKLPISGIDVFYKAFTLKVEKILLTAKVLNTNSSYSNAIIDIVRECTFNNVDMDNLPYADFEFLFLKIYALSKGFGFDIDVTCGKCETTTPVVINLDNATVNNTPETSKTKKISINENSGIILKYPKLSDINIDNITNEDIENQIDDVIVSHVESIYSGDNVYTEWERQELLDFINDLPLTIVEEIGAFLQKSPTVEMKLNFICPHCGHEEPIELRGLSSFLEL